MAASGRRSGARQVSRSPEHRPGNDAVATAPPFFQRVVLRTSRGPLAPLWKLAHASLLAFIVRVVRFQQPGTAVFVKGGFAFDTPVYGLSDLDLVAVTPDDGETDPPPADVARRRWEKLCRLVPVLRKLAPHFWVYRSHDLKVIAESTCFTFGFNGMNEDGGLPAAYMGTPRVVDEMGLLSNPGLFGLRREWRLLAGPDRLPPERFVSDQRRRIGCWAGLQFLWRYAFAACADPTPVHVPYLVVKLVADPVRIWLWLTRGQVVHDRVEALRRGLAEFPEEEEVIRLALELYRDLPRRPTPPLGEVLPAFARITERIAGRLVADTEAGGATDVRLAWSGDPELAVPPGWGNRLRRHLLDGAEPELLPLVDWRALVRPPLPDETLTVVEPPAIDLDIVSRAVLASRPPGSYAALRTNSLLLLPTTARTAMRCVQCSVTDPPSFALAAGDATARFPNVEGWSIRDWSRRAVAEHASWLEAHSPNDLTNSGEELARLFTAARAALLDVSVREGEPELPVTVGTVAARVGDVAENARRDADDAFAAYLEWRRESLAPPAGVVSAFGHRVRSLAAYTRAVR
jgi:hypothetical protein